MTPKYSSSDRIEVFFFPHIKHGSGEVRARCDLTEIHIPPILFFCHHEGVVINSRAKTLQLLFSTAYHGKRKTEK